MAPEFTRRHFLGLLSAAGTSMELAGGGAPRRLIYQPRHGETARPALLGGDPVRKREFPSWPVIEAAEREAWTEVLEKGRWNRGPNVASFETMWADRIGTSHAVATASGTSALYASLAALDVGPGDEVLVPPYTFVATINVVLLRFALPVFVDSDRETFQMDARKIEASISPHTRCLMPVHLGGNVADMDAVMQAGRLHEISVLEDACQAHLAEWNGKKVGSLGDMGCFSFQASKNLNSGEGGAIVTSRNDLAERAASFHNAGRPYRVGRNGRLVTDNSSGFSYVRNGDNRRLTEFQGALLIEQLRRLEEQTKRREENAAYLTGLLEEVEGIRPAAQYRGCTRNAYHLYMFRYDPRGFQGLSRGRFLEALSAEGIPCGSGYGPLNREPFLEETLRSRGFEQIYGKSRLDGWRERSRCPENDRLCEEAVWFTQTQLLGTRLDMDQIAEAIRKIRSHAGQLIETV